MSGGAKDILPRVKSPTLGFAAYYAAVREYLDRQIILRNGERIMILGK